MSAEKSRKRPLTIPTQLENIDGVEWLTFVYTAKGVSTDYRIRIDAETVDLDTLSMEFKTTNSVYPKAVCERKDYKGNRWDYETSVNEIGWKLCSLNGDLFDGKRGLLQRAVDSYRNRFPSSKSRRVARVEKTLGLNVSAPKKPRKPKSSKKVSIEENVNVPSPVASPAPTRPNTPPTLVKRRLQDVRASPTSSLRGFRTGSPPSELSLRRTKSEFSFLNQKDSQPTIPLPKTASRLIVETVRNSSPFQLRLRMDIDSIPEGIDREFILKNQPFPKPTTHRDFLCNSIAWKLAYLNKEFLDGHIELLQRSVDVYMEKYEDPIYVPRAGKRLMDTFFNKSS